MGNGTLEARWFHMFATPADGSRSIAALRVRERRRSKTKAAEGFFKGKGRK